MKLKIKVEEFNIKKNKSVECTISANIDYSSDKHKNIVPQDVFHAKGIAVCHKDDKFDTIKGKQIAYQKAKMKLYDKLYRKLNNTVKYHTESLSQLNSLIEDNNNYFLDTLTKLKDNDVNLQHLYGITSPELINELTNSK